MRNFYCTLKQARDFLTSSNIDMSREDDQRLMQYISWTSRLLEQHCGDRYFYPRLETRYYNYQKSYQLLLNEDLLNISSMTAAGTSISSSDYFLYPLNGYPKWKIEMDKSQSTIFNYSGTHQKAIKIIGTWGWHDDWDNAWLSSQDTVEDANLGANDTTVTVNDVDGNDADGFTPRFAKGQLLKIEDEYLFVTGTSWSDNTLTVKRGMNGTTAASHNQNTAISVYQPPGDIPLATLQGLKFIYEQRAATGGLILMPSLEGTVVRAELAQIWKGFRLPVRPDDLMVFV